MAALQCDALCVEEFVCARVYVCMYVSAFPLTEAYACCSRCAGGMHKGLSHSTCAICQCCLQSYTVGASQVIIYSNTFSF